MYMSKLTLLRHEAAHRGTGGIYDAHRLLWGLFDDDPDRRRDFLFRDLGEGSFLTVSARPPVDRRGIWRLEMKEYDPKLAEGERVHFSLRANAVRKTHDARGKQVRHDVVQDLRKRLVGEGKTPAELPPRLELAQKAGAKWLEARQESLGLAISEEETWVERYEADPLVKHDGSGRSTRGTVASLDLRGFATVADPEKLRLALFAGVGPAKGFGCGLLLVKRA